MEGLSGVASDGCEATDLTVVAPDLEVD
jgi:hypothetical protein